MQKDTFKSHRLTKQGLVLQGNRCEMALTFSDLAAIIEELSNVLPSEPRQETAVAAGWSGSRQRSMLDLAQHPKWTGRPERK